MPDESTPQSVLPIERRLATILCADVAGYSKMMAAKRQAADEALRRAQEERTQLEQEYKRIEAEKQAAANQQAAATAAKDAPKPGTSHDGTYGGRLCNLFTRPGDNTPACWRVMLEVRNGIAEGSWISKSQQTATAHGTIADDGSVKLNLAGWSPTGSPVEAILLGRISDGVITVSGQWSHGNKITGDWKRKQ